MAFTFDRMCVSSLLESPESAGILLALVNTFTRDRVGMALTRTAAAWLEARFWMEDRDGARPQSRLGWCS